MMMWYDIYDYIIVIDYIECINIITNHYVNNKITGIIFAIIYESKNNITGKINKYWYIVYWYL
jgi:hypothetical protein